MIGTQSIGMALDGLRSNVLRSMLTVLGMLIGVASVIILVSVGDGSSRAVQKRIEGLGTNILLVLRQGMRDRQGGPAPSPLTQHDAKALTDPGTAPDVATVSPTVNTQVTAVAQGNTYNPQQFIGTTPSYAGARNYTTQAGGFFTSDDLNTHSRVVVLGPTVVTNLYGNTDPVGQTIRLNGVTFQVVGVTSPKGSNGFQDQDDLAIAPITAVQDTLTGYGAPLNSITVQAKSRDQLDAAAAETSSILLGRHKIANARAADFRLVNQASLLQTSSATGKVFTTLLGIVAGISLFVAGIGVMNIMLVTVTERTREIGIRKAIGARRSDILTQFLVEAVLLSMFGAIAGVGGGLLGSQFKIAGVEPVVQPYAVVLAFSVAVVVGLFFGIYPANRAAALRPIEALRFE